MTVVKLVAMVVLSRRTLTEKGQLFLLVSCYRIYRLQGGCKAAAACAWLLFSGDTLWNVAMCEITLA